MALLWSGVLATLVGLGLYHASLQWHSGRMLEMLVIGILFAGAGMLAVRLLHWQAATCVALLFLVVLVLFSGLPAAGACLLFALAAIALGVRLVADENPALQGLLGCAVIVAVLGWSLPLPIHHPWVYAGACLLLIASNITGLRRSLGAVPRQWTAVVSPHPRLALFAVLLLGLASTACWLPTAQYDDLAYHLSLPWQLQDNAVYRLDPTYQVWALAPWAADVVQAIPQVIARAEARGAVNLLWLLATVAGIWRLAAQLQLPFAGRWLSVAMFASIPLTGALLAGMQTELPTVAALTWLSAWVLAPRHGGLRWWLVLTLLAGLLMAFKLLAGVMAAVLVLVALLRHRWPSPAGILAILLIGVLVAGSSYLYAYQVSGNPVLPLFNQIFHSPYFGQTAFIDARWLAGFNPRLPWDMTFFTGRYVEAHDGAAGFMMVALAGAWVLGLFARQTWLLALIATCLLALPLSQLQYLRYAYPGLVLLCPVMVAMAGNIDRRRGAGLVIAVCLLNFAFLANGHWMLRNGGVKLAILNAGNDEPFLKKYAPERLLAAQIRQRGTGEDNILLLHPQRPFFAEFGDRGRSVAWYSPSLQAAGERANADASGDGWVRLLRQQRISGVILVPALLQPGQTAALKTLDAVPAASIGDAQWWRLPAAQSPMESMR
ncbi:hypothetical protein ABB29_02445 [Pseudoxanthomonas dokdonensis]|uniref:Glycosyltransferase RgtA/B/C/D-like domain-containing protein n=2 Tax=Pseudoxanthomonas dokdonensis TaxID=344882 RepID=A0A0R0CPX4_9GAMM|nr:hypothetical protein ABB29_02445 [Pseudoxanthomonas dokdonensis]